MSAHAYTEDQLAEQPAIALFAELGWTTVSALDENTVELSHPIHRLSIGGTWATAPSFPPPAALQY